MPQGRPSLLAERWQPPSARDRPLAQLVPRAHQPAARSDRWRRMRKPRGSRGSRPPVLPLSQCAGNRSLPFRTRQFTLRIGSLPAEFSVPAPEMSTKREREAPQWALVMRHSLFLFVIPHSAVIPVSAAIQRNRPDAGFPVTGCCGFLAFGDLCVTGALTENKGDARRAKGKGWV